MSKMTCVALDVHRNNMIPLKKSWDTSLLFVKILNLSFMVLLFSLHQNGKMHHTQMLTLCLHCALY